MVHRCRYHVRRRPYTYCPRNNSIQALNGNQSSPLTANPNRSLILCVRTVPKLKTDSIATDTADLARDLRRMSNDPDDKSIRGGPHTSSWTNGTTLA